MQNEFLPPRRKGLIIQGGLILILLVFGGYFFFRAAQDPSGLNFLLDMLIALVLFLPLPLLLYRCYALLNAIYILRRDGLMIRWGLRREDIPFYQIEWMRPAAEFGFRLPLPWLRLPGGILGSRRVPELGLVEFMASNVRQMILVATPDKVYAISPEQANQFFQNFLQITELGSLAPIEAQSVYPKLLLGRVWEDRLARLLILSSLGIGVVLLIVVAIAVPGLDTINWVMPGVTAPAERLLLLPVLDGLIWLFNLLLGIFFIRRGSSQKIAAYMLWACAGLTGLMLLIASLLLVF